MINIHIYQPFFNYFKNIFCITKKLSKYKFFECQLYYSLSSLFQIELTITPKAINHSGISLCIGVFGLHLNLQIYDSRHSDDYE